MIRQALADARHRIPALALGALLLWAPLPFASITPRAAAALEIGGFLALALAASRAASLAPVRRSGWGAAALVAVALLGLVQSISWPRGLVHAISPQHLATVEPSRAVLGSAEPATLVPLSFDPATSRRTALGWFSCAALLAAATLVGDERRHRRLLLAALLAAAVFEVLYGAQGWFASSTSIWGVEVPNTTARLRGTFVNADHLALYLEIALAVAFAWTYWTLRRSRDEPTVERRLLRLAPPLAVWALLFAGLTFTASRAGLAAAVGATLLQGLLTFRRHGRRRWVMVGAALLGVGIAAAATLGFEQAFGRWLGTSAYELTLNVRLEADLAAASLWAAYPALGTGLGAFADVFAAVQPRDGLVWGHLHNDWLELALTTGALGLAAFLGGLIPLVRRLVVVLRQGHRSEDRAAAIAALGALAAVAFHSLLDFGLTMPANAATLAIVVGAAAGARAGDIPRRTVEDPEEQG
jgi:O-antigen ligase